MAFGAPEVLLLLLLLLVGGVVAIVYLTGARRDLQRASSVVDVEDD